MAMNKMMGRNPVITFGIGAGVMLLAACVTKYSERSDIVEVNVEALAAIGRVDERFQSYNVESVEVTGGNFWAPYPKPGDTDGSYDVGPHGVGFATEAYRKRPPLELADNERLQVLARALGPTYVRVSGSWANSIYFQDNDEPAMEPPQGYQGVLTRAQWAGVVEFAKRVDAKILTSFAISPGARDASGAWDPTQARRLFEYTQSLGGQIDAVELMNEPNVRQEAYAPDAYARDHAALQRLVEKVAPDTKVVGPGSTGEAGFKLFDVPPDKASTARLLSGTPQPKFDVFSYHFYGAVSQRCKSLGQRDPDNPREVTTSTDEALSEGWLSRADQAQRFYSRSRDQFAPGAPIWITETAQTACGGDPWSSTFLDTFRYIDQLGRFAKQGASVVFHNTLAASDYALIDDDTWLPRPNYWAALLWRRLMGEVVLDSAAMTHTDVRIYAHCLHGSRGGVGAVVVNLSRSQSAELKLSTPSEQYLLQADELESDQIKLNGSPLALTSQGSLPDVAGKKAGAGVVAIPPTTIAFLAVRDADNPACR